MSTRLFADPADPISEADTEDEDDDDENMPPVAGPQFGMGGRAAAPKKAGAKLKAAKARSEKIALQEAHDEIKREREKLIREKAALGERLRAATTGAAGVGAGGVLNPAAYGFLESVYAEKSTVSSCSGCLDVIIM